MDFTAPQSPLSQILAMIQSSHANSGSNAPMLSNNQVQAPPPGPYAGQGQNGGTGNPSGMSISGLFNSASNLQSLPWLSDAQNAGSMGGSLIQGLTGNAGMGQAAGSALSALASMFS